MLQVRLTQTAAERDAERKRSSSRHAMMLRDDARSIGMTTATKVGGRRQPKTYSRASVCISYYLDENGNKVNGRIFREPAQNKRARALKNLPVGQKLTCADLRPIFAD